MVVSALVTPGVLKSPLIGSTPRLPGLWPIWTLASQRELRCESKKRNGRVGFSIGVAVSLASESQPVKLRGPGVKPKTFGAWRLVRGLAEEPKNHSLSRMIGPPRVACGCFDLLE